MKVKVEIPLIDDILGEWRDDIGKDLPGYRNHVYRMVNFTCAFGDFDEEMTEKIVIAGCFHDIGIWPDNNLDYLPPSIDRARAYLKKNGREEWSDQISLMIDAHHKLSVYENEPLVEAFRKGDLADFSLGLRRSGLSKSFVREVKDAFPNAGFHKCLLKVAAQWFVRHPLNPVPILKR